MGFGISYLLFASLTGPVGLPSLRTGMRRSVEAGPLHARPVFSLVRFAHGAGGPSLATDRRAPAGGGRSASRSAGLPLVRFAHGAGGPSLATDRRAPVGGGRSASRSAGASQF